MLLTGILQYECVLDHIESPLELHTRTGPRSGIAHTGATCYSRYWQETSIPLIQGTSNDIIVWKYRQKDIPIETLFCAEYGD